MVSASSDERGGGGSASLPPMVERWGRSATFGITSWGGGGGSLPSHGIEGRQSPPPPGEQNGMTDAEKALPYRNFLSFAGDNDEMYMYYYRCH